MIGEPRWRVGRKVGRTIYMDGQLVGLMDTPDLARQVVEALAEIERLRDAIRELHTESDGRCTHCVEWCDCLNLTHCTHGNVDWPCPTVGLLDSTPGTSGIGERLRAEIERMRPVVEAATAFRVIAPPGYRALNPVVATLIAAVDAYGIAAGLEVTAR